MLKINGKTFMNLQEAVQWLLDNNALPFQSSANYVANTEIGMGTIVNPSPAKVRIGSLIFFADSKVSTVIGLTENGFICSDQYNNLVDDIAYVTNVAINASGHLITTLSDGQTIDAGIVKQVSGFSINGSQHLIVTFNDGTSTDLGAIFSGDISISGNISASGTITSPNILENNSTLNFSLTKKTQTNFTYEYVYAGVVKTGNKITFVLCMNITKTDVQGGNITLADFNFDSSIGSRLNTVNIGGYDVLDDRQLNLYSDLNTPLARNFVTSKPNNGRLQVGMNGAGDLVVNTKYFFRWECTFLLSENLAS